MATPKLPIGISDFKEMIQNQFYWVDKSLFIKEIIDDGAKVVLFTRPRRFGKTLNMSMLKYFFDANDSSCHSAFESLAIWQQGETYQQQRGKHPVIFLTLKGLKCLNFDDAMQELAVLLQMSFNEFAYLLQSDALDETAKTSINSIITKTATASDLRNSLKLFTRCLALHHKVNPILIMDEYDAPIHAAYANNYYRPMISFMQHFLGESLKDNFYLHKGILTGILRVAKESIFSGINNLQVCGVQQKLCAQYFGFLQSEVDDLLQAVNFQNKQAEVKAWYNGYQFGDHEVYNPWSILQYVKQEGIADAYWLNTSDNQLINQLIRVNLPHYKNHLETLMQLKPLKVELEQDIVFDDIEKRENALWNFLLNTGYLTLKNKRQDISGFFYADFLIPNKEVSLIYRTFIKRWFSEAAFSNNALIESLVHGDITVFKQKIGRFLAETFSYFDTQGRNKEQCYHVFVLGLVAHAMDYYTIRSNREAGEGRYDVVLIPKDKTRTGIIFEFKSLASDASLKLLSQAAEAALLQIKNNGYQTEFAQAGIASVLQLGIAFAGKQVEIVSEQLNLE